MIFRLVYSKSSLQIFVKGWTKRISWKAASLGTELLECIWLSFFGWHAGNAEHVLRVILDIISSAKNCVNLNRQKFGLTRDYCAARIDTDGWHSRQNSVDHRWRMEFMLFDFLTSSSLIQCNRVTTSVGTRCEYCESILSACTANMKISICKVLMVWGGPWQDTGGCSRVLLAVLWISVRWCSVLRARIWLKSK